MSFWTYLLECADGSFYAGHTDDLDARISQHRLGVPKCCTSTRLPVALVWSQAFGTREEALAAERQIKGWNRRKEQALVRDDWDEIKRLAWGARNPLPERLL